MCNIDADRPISPLSQVTVIDPKAGWRSLRLGELWRFRELILILTTRNVSIRYKQAVIGILWVILQPLITTLIFSIIFSRIARISAPGEMPYSLYVLSGLVIWQFFSSGVGEGSNSLIANKGMLTKVYFPRLILPISAVLVGVIDFFFALVALVALAIWHGAWPSWHAVFAPVFLGLALLLSLGLAALFSAVNAIYRDVGIALPYLLQLWMYTTPIIYPLAIVPPQWQWIIALNPMTGVVEGFRWAMFGTAMPDTSLLLLSFSVAIGGIVIGFEVFRRLERVFVDRI